LTGRAPSLCTAATWQTRGEQSECRPACVCAHVAHVHVLTMTHVCHIRACFCDCVAWLASPFHTKRWLLLGRYFERLLGYHSCMLLLHHA
jgi:hypothetical protein